MPFREKSAWINLVTLVIAGGFFVASFHHFSLFFAAVAAFVVLQLVLHFTSARLAPKDAAVPPDEREQLIRLKASRNAYGALIIGALVVPLTMHFAFPDPSLWFRVRLMAHIAVVAVILAETVRAISQIVYFRLGR